MNNYELHLEPIRYRKSNGQFVKGHIPDNKFIEGHIPHNKGKRWNDYMSIEKQNNCRNALKLGRLRCRKIVGIDKEGRWCIFHSSCDAARKIQGCEAALIRRCCRRKDIHRHNGIKWFFENDPEWFNQIDK